MAEQVCPTCGGTGIAPDTRSRVKELLDEGITQAEIARRLSISRARVGQIKASLDKSAS